MSRIRYTAVAVIVFGAASVMAQPGKPTSPPKPPVPAQIDGKPVTEWIAALKDENIDARVKAVEVLGRSQSPDAIKPLRDRLLNDDESPVRAAAATALGRHGPRAVAAVKNLIEIYEDDEEPGGVRMACLDALGQIGTKAQKKASTVVLAALNNPEFTRHALKAFQAIETTAAIPKLAEAIKMKDVQLSEVLLQEIKALGPAAKALTPALAEHVKDEKVEIRRLVTNVLSYVDSSSPEAAQALADALGDEDLQVRKFAVEGLQRLIPLSRVALPRLIDGLKEAEPGVRGGCLEIVGRLGPAAKDAVPAIIAIAADEKDPSRRNAINALGYLRGAGAAGIPTLIQIVETKKDFSGEAARSLGSMGATAKEAIPVLISCLTAKDGNLQGESTRALSLMGKDAIEPLTKCLKHESPQVRVLATQTLGMMGPNAEASVPALRDVLKDKDANVRTNAVGALMQIGRPAKDAVPDLLAIFEDASAPMPLRQMAARALGALTYDGEVLKKIVPLAKNPSAELRTLAALALAGGGNDAAGAVEDLVKDPDPKVANPAKQAKHDIARDKAIAESLAKLNSADEKVRRHAGLTVAEKDRRRRDLIPALTACLKDSESGIRIRAACCLHDMSGFISLGSQSVEILDALCEAYASKGEEPHIRQEIAKAIKKIDAQVAYNVGIR